MTQNEQPTGVGLWFGVLDVGWELGEDVISSCVGLSLFGGQFGIPEQSGTEAGDGVRDTVGPNHLDSINTWTGAQFQTENMLHTHTGLAAYPLTSLTLKSIYNAKNFTGNKRKI